MVRDRVTEESSERPIFVGGQPSATGKYEAVFESAIGPEPKQDREKLPVVEHLGSTSMCKYKATYQGKPTSAAVEASAKGVQEKGGMQANSLGKPVSEKEVRIITFNPNESRSCIFKACDTSGRW